MAICKHSWEVQQGLLGRPPANGLRNQASALPMWHLTLWLIRSKIIILKVSRIWRNEIFLIYDYLIRDIFLHLSIHFLLGIELNSIFLVSGKGFHLIDNNWLFVASMPRKITLNHCQVLVFPGMIVWANTPFYSVLSCLAFEWKWDWRWPCFDRNLTAFLM